MSSIWKCQFWPQKSIHRYCRRAAMDRVSHACSECVAVFPRGEQCTELPRRRVEARAVKAYVWNPQKAAQPSKGGEPSKGGATLKSVGGPSKGMTSPWVT